MCIICIKKAGVAMPDKATVRTMWVNNSDGAGYMYTHKGQVVIKKGFMTLTALQDSLDTLAENHDLQEVPIIFHFRIGTAGGNTAQNTHPFAISEKVPVLQKLRLKTDVGVVHNGIIHITTSQPDISDTMEYIKDRLSLRKMGNPNFYKSEFIQELMYREITSKLAFLNGAGEVYTVGDFQTDEKTGLVYSNGTWKERTYYVSKYYNGTEFDYDSFYNNYKKKKMFMMLDGAECYLKGTDGVLYEADGFYMAVNGDIYEYTYINDKVTKTNYTAVTHAGQPLKYIYNKLTCDLMEYDDVVY